MTSNGRLLGPQALRNFETHPVIRAQLATGGNLGARVGKEAQFELVVSAGPSFN
jgi:hypothetical protein